MMLEWWASEICILVSGLLPAPALALSSLSIVQSVNAVAFMLPLGASVAGATRVGAALGRADHEGARCAAATCGSLGVCFGATTGLLLLLLRRGVGGLFTQDEEVVSHKDTSHPASHARSDGQSTTDTRRHAATHGCGQPYSLTTQRPVLSHHHYVQVR